MRIAILAPLVTPILPAQMGGAQSVVADIAAGLTDRGHLVEVFAATGSRIPDVRVVDTGVNAGYLAADLFRPGGDPGSGSGQLRNAYQRAYGAIMRSRPDIVHNHGFDVPAIELAQQLETPVVHTLHLPPEPSIAGAIKKARAQERPPIIVAPSRFQANSWAPLVDIDVVISNGVAVDQIPWSPEAGSELLFAGRLSPEKGALEAIQIALRAGLPLALIGHAYDPAYAAEVAREAGKSGLINVEPPLSRHLLWQRMMGSRAVLCPVAWDEPFGLVAAEAQAAGCPVVAFNRGGLPEVIKNGLTGVLVASGDVKAAALAASAAGDFARKNCRRHAEINLDLKDTLDAHEDLYLSLLDPDFVFGEFDHSLDY